MRHTGPVSGSDCSHTGCGPPLNSAREVELYCCRTFLNSNVFQFERVRKNAEWLVVVCVLTGGPTRSLGISGQCSSLTNRDAQLGPHLALILKSEEPGCPGSLNRKVR